MNNFQNSNQLQSLQKSSIQAKPRNIDFQAVYRILLKAYLRNHPVHPTSKALKKDNNDGKKDV